ncbi:substrate-binding domain-containing protein [Gluconacetobacter diazotrophicus]|uniref:Putative periplasmic binding proteins n=1 Tax=Gluconacetobacter diazotrophicus (strain ATCC 49037 / DSM 5601 / CCUG 37298 / CIP 103539 / LMG 7603 / PAl5) TaxID=272568 RepID=A9H577_GLUDA|nr:substrate-binding domain-containing protein [Gluconacetobacter diazotrophicus]CAP54297.1 putative periplasmic binding proteins [Gluconacetobacter diazotrophicus PA1 5]
MKKSSVIAAGILALSSAAWVPAGRAADKSINIIMVTHGQAADPFWAVVRNGAKVAAQQAGVHVEFRQPDTFDMTQMANLITAAVSQHPDGLVVSVPDVDALSGPIHKALAAGINVIATNAAAETARQVGVGLDVGQEESTAGEAAGAAMKKAGGTNALCVNQEPGNVALDHRCAGFAKAFGKSKVLPVDMDTSSTKAKIQGALRADPTIDTIIGLGAETVGEPAVSAVKALGLTGKVRVGAFDLAPGFLQEIRDGQALFAVDQQPYLQGYLPVMFLALKVRYGMMPASDVASGPSLVMKDQAASVIALSGQGIR